ELLLTAALLEWYSSFIFSCNLWTSFSPGGIQADVAFASMTAILLLGQAGNVVQRGPAARSGTTIYGGGPRSSTGLINPRRPPCFVTPPERGVEMGPFESIIQSTSDIDGSRGEQPFRDDSDAVFLHGL
ncbi:hypothetical protein THAOC_24765, partial [Thalassiosira oceanica]